MSSKRVELNKGDIVENNGTVYMINETVGEGAHCLVYRAKKYDSAKKQIYGNQLILKEFYPYDVDGISRTGQLLCIDKKNQEQFDTYKESFLKSGKKGQELYDASGIYGIRSPIIDTFEANHTIYSVSLAGSEDGCSLMDCEKVKDYSIHDIAQLMISLTKFAKSLHEKNYLYLDFKPENIYLPNPDDPTNIELFDFDTLVEKENLVTTYPTYSYGWTAPEQMSTNGWTNGNVGEKSDVYALGGMFLWLITQKKVRPIDWYETDTLEDYLNDDRQNEKDILSLLQRIINKTLELVPQKRFNDDELLDALNKLETYTLSKKEAPHLFSLSKKILSIYAPKTTLTSPYATQSNNAYAFQALSSKFVGRREELKILESFARKKDTLLWTGIFGEGGSGKSRLALQFLNKMNASKKWVTHFCEASEDNLFTIRNEYVLHIQSDTIICIDNIHTYMDEVMDCISYAGNNLTGEYKLRFILIERNPDVLYENGSNNYSSGKFIECNALDDNCLIHIMNSYAEKVHGKKLDHDSSQLILDTIHSVDPIQTRPLYVQFITDAFCKNEDVSKWKNDETVKYIVNKFMKRIYSSIHSLSANKSEEADLKQVIQYLCIKACFLDGTELSDWDELNISVKENDIRYVLSEEHLLDETQTMIFRQNDLSGEYTCLSMLCNLKDAYASKLFEVMLNDHFEEMINYAGSLYQDFPQMFENRSWLRNIEVIEFPNDLTMKNNAFRNCGFIKKMILTEGIARISKNAFRDCDHLKEINIPNSVETIDSGAFENCHDLERITFDTKGFNSELKVINQYAFAGCENLKYFNEMDVGPFVLPRKLEKIERCAFENCSSLYNVSLDGSKVREIQESVFAYCTSLGEITFNVTEINANAFYECTSLQMINSNAPVRSIGISAFENCKSLNNILVAKTIEEKAYKGCESLCEVDLSQAALQAIPNSCFENCISLKTLILPEECKVIGTSAFAGCCSLEKLEIPNDLESIEIHAFDGCSENIWQLFKPMLKKTSNKYGFEFIGFGDEELQFIREACLSEVVKIPNTVKRVFAKAFYDNKILKEIHIPSSVKTIEDDAFCKCTALETVVIEGDDLNYIGAGAFKDCINLKNIAGKIAVSEVLEETFANCESIESIFFSNHLEKIGRKAFSGCYRLNYITDQIVDCICADAFNESDIKIPQCYCDGDDPRQLEMLGMHFTQYDDEVFAFLNSYWKNERIHIPDSCIEIKESTFQNHMNIKEIFIPDSIRILPNDMFSQMGKLEIVHLPNTIKNIPEKAFYECRKLKQIIFDDHDPNVIPNGVTIAQEAFLGCESLETIKLPEDLTVVPPSAFRYCKKIKQVIVPMTLEVIAENAFDDCCELESVSTDGSFGVKLRDTNLLSIGSSAFKDCAKIEEVEISREIKYIPKSCFHFCDHLKKVKLPKKVEMICEDAFRCCNDLENIKIFRNCRKIEKRAFSACKSLKEIQLSIGLVEIDQAAFQYCANLETINFPSSLQMVSREAFKGCTKLKEIEIPDLIQEIPDDCFRECRSLQKIVFSDSVRRIGKNAFRKNELLEEIRLPNSLEIIDEAAFYACNNIKSIEIPESVKNISSDTFRECTNLETVKFHALTAVGLKAFMNCICLTDIPIQNISEEISDYAFYNCQNLKEVVLSQNLKQLGEGVFSHCKQLQNIYFPENLLKIPNYCFRSDVSLRSIDLPSTLQCISYSSFRDCINLEDIQCASENVIVERYAFKGCEYLDEDDLLETWDIDADAFDE